jgi:hypothetical protein
MIRGQLDKTLTLLDGTMRFYPLDDWFMGNARPR